MKVSLEIDWTFFLQFRSQGIVQVSVEALYSKYDVGGLSIGPGLSIVV